jgi:FtsH-binding integral membrane protein
MRAIYITLLVTLITAIIGTYSNINFANANFGLFLFVGLLCLLGFQTARLFMEFSRKTSRYWAICGAFLFSLYLLFDFNLLMQLSERTNDWNTALFMAYSIYLDVLNLILEILDAMSNS